MKIFVLGSNGMLGRYVSTYLSKKNTVINLNIDELDAEEVTYSIHKLWEFPVHLISEDDKGYVDEIAQFD